MDHSNIVLKCSFLGEFSVGKTSLITRYMKNTFNGAYIPTIGADFLTIPLKINRQKDITDFANHNEYILRQLNITNDEFLELNLRISRDIKIYVWDLAGEPLLDKLRDHYMIQTFLAVIVVDLNRPNTFQIESWINQVKKISPDCEILLAGSKSDLIDLNDQDLRKNINTIEDKYNLTVNITSSKDGNGVKELFTLIKLNILKRIFS